ncbi:MAG TPA: PAS domain-containing protein, partial [Desulfobulbus sp.]|nr:PAS domain-containing protein [Desulfobulbus sp.]
MSMTQEKNVGSSFSIYNSQGTLRRNVLQQSYAHGPNPTRIVDRNFRILDQNPAMNRLTEYLFSEKDNKRCYEVIRALELCGTEQCPLQQIMAGADSVEIHCRRETWQGRTFSGRVLAVPLRDEQGVVIGMIEITVDENDVMALSRELRRKNDVLRKSKRLLAAHAEVARALNRESSLELLASRSLELLCQHTPAVLGVVYLVDEKEEMFLPLASHALDRKPKEVNLKQGLPGQLIIDGRDRYIDYVPPGYFHYSSGSGEAKPEFLACLAVHAGAKLLAVLELGAFESLEPLKSFLANVSHELGLALEKALALKQSEAFAAQLEQKRQVLEAQNDELQAQSEELIAQSEEIQSQAEEIEAQRDDLELKTAEAEEANRMKSVFLANMSHELRTPLNALLGLTVLLRERKAGPLTASQEKYLEVIHRNGSILLQQLDDIL